MAEPPTLIRLDKWLWHGRFFKSRSRASKVVSAGHVRLNGVKVLKPATPVRAGDTLTFAQARVIRVVRVLAPGVRRGPAAEARCLFEDLSPPKSPGQDLAAPRFDGKGRPTKKDRRQLEQRRP